MLMIALKNGLLRTVELSLAFEAIIFIGIFTMSKCKGNTITESIKDAFESVTSNLEMTISTVFGLFILFTVAGYFGYFLTEEYFWEYIKLIAEAAPSK